MTTTTTTLRALFTIDKGAGGTVRADTVEMAAGVYARRRYGRTRSAERVTGSRGLSGYFQAYRQERDGTLNSVGTAYHVG